VTGSANNATFPTTAGAYDPTFGPGASSSGEAFVTKLNPSGSALVYSTYLGGEGGTTSGVIAVDGGGSAYVTGGATANFPTTPGVYGTSPVDGRTTFVVRLNSAGSAPIFSTFMYPGTAIALDTVGDAYLTASTTSSTVDTSPTAHDLTYNGATDASVYKLDATGSTLLYASYLGGSSSDTARDIAVHQGRAYVLGTTSSADFPTTPGAFDQVRGGSADLFISKLDTTIYGPARPKTATPTNIRLAPAYKPCMSANAAHGAPLEVASCSPAQQSSDFLTVGTPESNALQAAFAGSLAIKTLTEAPIDLTNGDQSDLAISFSMTDVRRKSDLVDYLGEVKVVIPFRLTDRYNATSRVHWGTATDSILSFVTNCIPTSGSAGSTCSANTTADAVVPGITPEFKRAMWQLGQVQVWDGGSDGEADDTSNTLFATQGLFVP
jgi:hypothetical protein